jgi:hypothetical protein
MVPLPINLHVRHVMALMHGPSVVRGCKQIVQYLWARGIILARAAFATLIGLACAGLAP